MIQLTTSVAVVEKMTYREQQQIKAAIRANTALLRQQIVEKEKELIADLDRQIRLIQHEAEREADKLRRELEKATLAFNNRVKDICAKFPELFTSGSWSTPNSVHCPHVYRNHDDRTARVQVAKARVRAQVEAARTAVQVQETQQILKLSRATVHNQDGIDFLNNLPSIDDLFRVPVAEIEDDRPKVEL